MRACALRRRLRARSAPGTLSRLRRNGGSRGGRARPCVAAHRRGRVGHVRSRSGSWCGCRGRPAVAQTTCAPTARTPGEGSARSGSAVAQDLAPRRPRPRCRPKARQAVREGAAAAARLPRVRAPLAVTPGPAPLVSRSMTLIPALPPLLIRSPRREPEVRRPPRHTSSSTPSPTSTRGVSGSRSVSRATSSCHRT